MAKGILDLWVNPDLDESSMTLVTDCFNGYPHDLYLLQDGDEIMLIKGKYERYVQVIRESGTECTFHYMELHPDTAKDLGLEHGSRYQVYYDEDQKTMKITPLSISRTNVTVLIDRRQNDNKRVVIGYSLLGILGMAEQARSQITIMRGAATEKLRLIVPENELDEVFVLSSATAAKLGLTHGSKQVIEYNHSTHVLCFPGNKTYVKPAAAAKRVPVRNNRKASPSPAAYPKMKPKRVAAKPAAAPVSRKKVPLSLPRRAALWLNPIFNIKRPMR